MNNPRLFSLLSIAFLLSYAGNTICTTDEAQQTVNVLAADVAKVVMDFANHFTNEDSPHHERIHGAVEVTRRNLTRQTILFFGHNKTGTFYENRIAFLKSDDGYGVLEALAENFGPMAIDWGINKASKIDVINDMIKGAGKIISNDTVRYTTGVAIKIVATHLAWNGLKMLFNNND